jgi:hypothetical protein
MIQNSKRKFTREPWYACKSEASFARFFIAHILAAYDI